MDRANRIGRTRAVYVSRILTDKTYEMKTFHISSLKLGLERAVMAHQQKNTEDHGIIDNG